MMLRSPWPPNSGQRRRDVDASDADAVANISFVSEARAPSVATLCYAVSGAEPTSRRRVANLNLATGPDLSSNDRVGAARIPSKRV